MSVYSVHSPRGQVCQQCHFSNSLFFRMKGLLGRTSLVPLEGLWLKPCNSIHMFFMRFSIDALFLDKQQCIVKVYHSLPPWAISSLIFRAESVLELAAGRAKELGLQIGDQLVFTDTSNTLLEKSSHD